MSPTLDETGQPNPGAPDAAPGDDASLDALEAAWRQAGRLPDLLALLERQARGAGDPVAAARLLLRAGSVALNDVGDPGRAEELVLRALALDPGGREALRALAEVREQRGDVGGLADALEREADRTEDRGEAARRYLALGRLCEERLSRRDRALLFYGRALRLDPVLDEARRRALACAAALGRHAHAKRILDAWRDAGGERRDLAAAYAALGAALADEPFEHGLALEATVDALALDRGVPGGAETLSRLKSAPRAWREHAAALAAKAAGIADRVEAARAWLRLAGIHAAYDPDGAARVREAFDRAWASAPGLPQALDFLERWHEERGDAEGLRHELERLAAETRDLGAAVEVSLRLARQRLERLGDAAGALAALERALELDPACETAALQAFEMHSDAGRSREALSVLDRHLAARPRKPEHAALRLRAAELALADGDPDLARRQVEGALREAPGSAAAARALVPLLEASGDAARLVEALEIQAAAERDPEARAALLERVAEIQARRLGDPREAVRVLGRALAAVPGSERVRSALEAEAGSAGAWPELARALRGAAAVASDPAVRDALSARAEEIQETRLVAPGEGARPARGPSTWSSHPASLRARVAVLRAADGREAAEELCEALSRLAAQGAPDAAELLAERAALLAEPLGQLRDSALAWLGLLEGGGLGAAGSARAVRALESLLGRSVEPGRIARALAPAYAAAGDTARHVEMIERIARDEGATPDERARLWLDASAIRLERLGDLRGALDAAVAAMRQDPAHAEARRRVEDLATGARAFPELYAVLAEAADRLGGNPAEERAVRLRAARVAEEELGSNEKASTQLRRARTLAPAAPEILAALTRLALAGERWDESRDLLVERARNASTTPERVALLTQLGDIQLERLAAPAQAAATYREALGLAAREQRPRLLARLGRALEAQGDRAGQAEVLAELAAIPAGPAAPPVRRPPPAVDPGAALALARAALERDARDGAAFEDVVRHATALDRPADLAWALERRRAALPGATGDLAFRLAELKRTRLGDPAGALRLLGEVLRGDPTHAGAVAAVAALARVPGPIGRDALAQADGLLQAAGDAAARVAVRHARLEQLEDPAERARIHAEIRALLEEDLGDPGRALDAARAAFAEGGKAREDALADVPRLAEKAGRYGVLAELCEMAAAESGGARSVELFRRAARVRDAWMDDPAAAANAWRRLLAAAPGDVEALEALDRILSRERKVEELVPVLEGLAAALGADAQKRRDVLLRRAVLLEGAADAHVAVDAYGRLLEEHPQDAAALAGLARVLGRPGARDAAARLLERVHRASGDVAALAELLEVRAGDAAPEERRTLLGELSALRERLGQLPAALDAKARQYRETPRDATEEPSLRAELDRLAVQAGSLPALASALEEALRDGLPPAAATEVRRRLAALYGERLDDPRRAAELLEALAGDDPRPEVLADLARLHRRCEAWRELAGVLHRQADRADDARQRRDLWWEAAEILEERLADREGAMDAYRKILAVDPDDAGALAHLGRLLGAAERWDEVAALLDREAAAAERRPEADAEAAELRFRIGRVRQQRLADPAAALEAYRAVLARVPRHPAALAALEELARGSGPTAAEAAAVLEPIYEREGEHRRLVDALEARLPSLSTAAERAALLRRVADVYAGPLKSPEMALVAASRALREEPDSLAGLDAVERLAAQADAAEELAALLAENADRAGEPRVRAEYHRRLARLARAEPVRSAEEWRKVLDLAPDDPEALESLTALHRDAGDPGALAQVLRRRLAGEEDEARRAALLSDLGTAQEAAGDVAGALTTLRRLQEARPEDREVAARLDALCERSERWAELAEVLARRIALADAAGDAPGATELRTRLAVLRDDRLLDRAGAQSLFEEILGRDPSHGTALERLEAARVRDPANLQAALALEAAHAAAGRWDRHAEVLAARAADRPDPMERKALFVRLAEVEERRLGNPERAFVSLARALRDDPADAELRAVLERLADATGQEEELAVLYEEQLPRLGADGAPVALELGALHEGPLAMPEEAPRFYEQARRLDPAAAAVALPALERLYRKLGRFPELADVLGALAARETRAEERVALLFRLAQVWEENLSLPERAVAAHEAVLQSSPGHLPSLRALQRLHEQASRDEALLAALSAERDLGDAASRERLTARMAEVAARLGRPGDAVELWRESLRLRPQNEPALAALEALLERTERWPELAEVLESRVAAAQDRRDRVRLHEKLGRLAADRLADPPRAVRSFQAALEIDPRNRGALEALRDLHAARGDAEGEAQAWRRLIPLQEDAAGVKRARLALAEVLLGAGHRQEAAEQGKRAFDLEPHDAADLARLEAVLQASGAAAEATRATEARAALLSAAGDRAGAVAAWQAAATAWRSAGRRAEAAAALQKALTLDPAGRATFDQLRALHADAGDWRPWTQATDLFVSRCEDRATRVALLQELAEVQENRLGQKEMAFLAWSRACQDAPGDETVRAALERLAAETGSFEELVEIYEEACEALPAPLQARTQVRIGELRDRELDDPAGAERAFRRALEVDPGSLAPLDALASLFERRGRARDLVIVLEQRVEAVAGLEEKKGTLLRMARLHDAELSDPDEAVSALRRLLELDGGDAAALEALVSLYRRGRRWPDLAQALARARDLAPDAPARIGWQLQLAALLENELADEEGAVEAYRAVLGMDARHPAALAGLERLYTRLDRFAELNRVYEMQVENAQDPAEKVRILGKSAAIWEEKLQNPQKAIERNEQVLRLDPGQLPAVRSLERLYRQEGVWDRLIEVTRHHLERTSDRQEQVLLWVALGEVHWNQLQRADQAEEAFRHALELDPDSRDAVGSLARLYERSGNWSLALEMLRRDARLAGAGPDAVDLHHRMGRIQEEMLLDTRAARQEYQRALDLDAGHLPSLRALKSLCLADGDRDEYLSLLLAEARYVTDEALQADLLSEAGRIHLDERDDPEGAARLFEEALHHVPSHLASAQPLSEIYQARGAWADAARALEIVTAQLGAAGDPRELSRQFYRLGHVREKLEQGEAALAAYRRAYELDATYLPALEGLGALLFQRQAWEESLRIFQSILIHHRDALTDLEVVQTYWQIGEIQDRQGQRERAARSLEKALEMDPNHEASRRSLVRVLEALGDWERSVEHRLRLAPLLVGPERHAQYVAVGEICRDRLSDPYQAIDAFLQATRSDPRDLAATEALLGLYRQTRQGQKAADVMERILQVPEVQADRRRAAQLHLALGELFRDELRDPARAIENMEKALDADPSLVKAFAAEEQLLGSARRWSDLEQAYVRMIQRLPRTPDTAAARTALWRELGELYRRGLGDNASARTAYEVVVKASPDDVAALETYAALAAAEPGHEDEAVDAWRRLLALGVDPARDISHLVSLFAARKDYERAYSAAQVLTYLVGGASPEQVDVVTRLRRYAREVATRSLDDAGWQRLLHERLRGGPLPAILALVAREAGSLFVQTPKEVGLNPRKDEIDLSSSLLFLASTLKYVARTLGVDGVRLFRSAGAAGRLGFANTEPPAVLAGEEMFQERPKKELWFSVARAVAFVRPELRLGRLMPHDQLEAVFQAACSLGTSRFVVTADPGLVQRLRAQLERVLSEHTRTQTLKRLARAYCDVQQPGDVRAHMDAVELTANRAGALLAGDLDVARRLALEEKAQVSKLKDETKLRDLTTFCMSEDWTELREALGLSVVVK